MSLGRNAVAAAAFLAIAAPFALAPPAPLDSELITHEWGTFTSVADQDGNPMEWAPLTGAPDLPCFVEHLGTGNFKASSSGLVRMETPVMYFYSPRPVTLSVRVQFPRGLITEWYPRSSVAESNAPPPDFSQIQWNSVEVSPADNPEFPSIQGHSRYFAARDTDATPLQIDGQQEKFIFYRGVGSFSIPLRPKFLSDSKLQIRNSHPASIPLAIVFENHDSKIGYRIATGIKDTIELDAPQLTGNLSDLRQAIAGSLVEFGLYKKEARAMLDTWQDSWFEEGTRIFYIVPRERIDSALPVEIKPAPESIARVFVGRVEILSPWMRLKILTALSTGDTATLAKFGRFLDPFLSQLRENGAVSESTASSQYIQQAREQIAKTFNSISCIR